MEISMKKIKRIKRGGTPKRSNKYNTGFIGVKTFIKENEKRD
jgi:hypothetical protein